MEKQIHVGMFKKKTNQLSQFLIFDGPLSLNDVCENTGSTKFMWPNHVIVKAFCWN